MGKDDSDSDDDSYVYYGTPLQDEAATGPGRDKAPQDPAQTRSLPVHQQASGGARGLRAFGCSRTGAWRGVQAHRRSSMHLTKASRAAWRGWLPSTMAPQPLPALSAVCPRSPLRPAWPCSMPAGGDG